MTKIHIYPAFSLIVSLAMISVHYKGECIARHVSTFFACSAICCAVRHLKNLHVYIIYTAHENVNFNYHNIISYSTIQPEMFAMNQNFVV